MQDSVSLKGNIVITEGPTFSFKIKLRNNVKSKTLLGVSILDEGGAFETISKVEVRVIAENKTLILKEKELIYSKSKETNFCFINGVITVNAQKKSSKGMFIGKDLHDKFCGRGLIILNYDALSAAGLLKLDSVGDVISKKEDGRLALKSGDNQYMRVKGGEVDLHVWDGGVEDGDSLAIFLNNTLIHSVVAIKNEKATFSLSLKKGYNEVKIKALNEGREPINSARISLVAGGEKKELVSYLKEGEEASIMVERVE